MKLKSLLQTTLLLLFVFTLGIPNVSAQWKINEGFEGGVIPSSWKIYDVNGDNNKWKASNKPNQAHSGTWIAMVEAFSGTGLMDILVTPQVQISAGDQLRFFARSWYGLENLNIKISTTGNAINNFNITVAEIVGITTTYNEYVYDLSAYAGQNIYISFQWLRDDYALVLDDIKVGQQMPLDLGVVSVDSPSGFHLTSDTVTPVASIKNFGSSAVSESFPVNCVITDTADEVVYSSVKTFSRSLAAGAQDTVRFDNWLPETEGLYNITMYTAVANDADMTNDTLTSETEIVQHFGTGGPDGMSYQWIDSFEPNGPQYNWIDISATGQSAVMFGVDSFYGDDNISEPIPLGFDFNYYGISRSYFQADINGSLFLSTPTAWYKPYPDTYWNEDGNLFNYMYQVPGYRNMPSLISVFWDDLEAVEGTGNVYFQTFGEAPDRYCVVQWNNLKFRAGTGAQNLQFEVILHENGDIVMQYLNVATGQTGSNIPHDFGQSATVGIQNDDWSTGLGYLNEIVVNNEYQGYSPAGNLLKNEMAIRFFIGEDNQGPVINHDMAWNTFSNNTQLTATIVDVNGIAADTLFYNYGNGWDFVINDSVVGTTYYYSLNNIPTGSQVNYKIVAVDGSANSNHTELTAINNETLTFKVLPTAGTEVIVLTPGNRPGYSDYTGKELNVFMNALESLGVAYDVYNFSKFESFRLPESYDIAFAYHNTAVANPTFDTLSRALIDFMELGTNGQPKNVYLAGDDIAQGQHSLDNSRYYKQLMAGYIRAAFEVQPNPPVFGGTDGIGGPDTPGDAEGTIKGQPNSPIGIDGVELGVFADSPDVIYARTAPDWMPEVPNPGRVPGVSYRFEDGPINGDAYSKGRPCALWLNNDIYKSYFISFNMSTIDSASAVSMISQAMIWFTPESFNVTVMALPEDGGTVSGGGEYVTGSTATVIATPYEGYNFIEWRENNIPVSNDSQYSFTVTGNHDLEAYFGVAMHEVNAVALPAEGGNISGGVSYPHGSTANLTATPNENYVFLNWTTNGNVVSTQNEISFEVTADTSLTANFESTLVTLTVVATPAEGGTVSGAGSFQPGTEVTVIATPDPDYTFVNWTVDGEEVSIDSSYTFIITQSLTITANFASTVGTSFAEKGKVMLTPNPTTDYVQVDFNGQKVDRIEIFNSTGFVSAHKSDHGSSFQVNFSSLPKGVYFLRVIMENGEVETHKVIHN